MAEIRRDLLPQRDDLRQAPQRRMVERFAALIKPEALLRRPRGEHLVDQGVHFRLRGQTVYEPAAK